MSRCKKPWYTRERLHEIIYEADTPEGKGFDVILLIFILASVAIVMLESVRPIQERYGELFTVLEWIFTIFFTIEYLLRIYLVNKPSRYIFSFYGIIDLLAIIPTYASLVFDGTHYLVVIRALRLLRVFRIFKLGTYMSQGSQLWNAIKASRSKIFVFLYFILLMVIIIGAVMYFIEGGQEGTGFTSIPRSIYWAIVTLTTVGYGDITPQTNLGQLISAIVMIMGYAVIAVPTGIISAEMVNPHDEHQKLNTQTCPNCSLEGHDNDADFCKHCGADLHSH